MKRKRCTVAHQRARACPARDAAEGDDGGYSLVDHLNATSMERLRFSDFHELRSGRDAASALKLDQIRERVSAESLRVAEAEFGESPKQLAVCLRWIVRGLNADKAVRKVATVVEVSMNAAAARGGRRR